MSLSYIDTEKVLDAIMYASYLAFPLLVVAIYLLIRKRASLKRLTGALLAISIILTLFFVWARFIERYMIQVKTTGINLGVNQRIALIADTHIGAYKSRNYLAKVVSEISNINDVDMVVIAGDFSYHSSDPEHDFEPLSKLKVPVYAVLGNHDYGISREGVVDGVKSGVENAIRKYGVINITNKVVEFEDFTLLGLGDNWAHEDDVDILKGLNGQDKPIVVLTHNPDTTSLYPTIKSKALTLTGHTHCGQIRIPFLYQKAIPTSGAFYDGGIYDRGDKGQLFITCGLGEVGLPLRLFNPPTIDILNL